MKAYCLLNHNLTENQINELTEIYHCNEIQYPSEELKNSWSQIPAEINLDHKTLQSVINWIKNALPNDILIIQGEFGSTFYVVDYALKKGLIPVHAVTKRICKEKVTNEIVERYYIFEHVCFRKYMSYTA